jgi:hypothetical protein
MKTEAVSERSNPLAGRCPRCGGFFVAVDRATFAFGTSSAMDLLEWRCADCGHKAREVRRITGGSNGEWPASKFAGQ